MNADNHSINRFRRYKFSKKALFDFVAYLKNIAPVYAPHKKGDNSYAYEKVNRVNDVVLDYPRTMQPLKKFFLPPREVLLRFNMRSNTFTRVTPEVRKRIFFAIHSYEMAGLKRLDYSFANGHAESNYIKRRQQSVFIGITYTPDEWHFSSSVGIRVEETEGFDLFIWPQDGAYYILEITDVGKELLQKYPACPSEDSTPLEAEITFHTKLKYHYNRIPKVFEHVYKSKVWDKYGDICVGCGTCNLLCATCYCFDVRDEVELDTENGTRTRYWDGCMLNAFAEVAGGENFRGSLARRTRHRLYRKFRYITQKSEMLHCIGCGRCSAYCPAGIKITDIVNDLIEDYEEKQVQENY